jgi:ribosome-associated translation inhibitor RaiA
MLARGFMITPALRTYLDRRLRASLVPAKDKIQDIAIRLRDLNGPRGGRDMLCQVSITVPGHPTVLVKEIQENMYSAIDGAVKRAAYRAIRLLMRQRIAVRQAAKSLAKTKDKYLTFDSATEDTRFGPTAALRTGRTPQPNNDRD